MIITPEYVRQNYICGNKFRDLADHEATPWTTIPDSARVIFCKTDYYEAIIPQLVALPHKFILITHNGDIPATPERAAILPPNCVAWFAQNNLSGDSRVISIPIGIANSEWQHGNIEALLHGWTTGPLLPDKLAYFSINIQTTPSRQKISEYYSGQEWCTKGTGFHPYAEYCAKVRKHFCNISPPGNGADCHRHWETWYLGRIPVIQRNQGMKAFEMAGLPAIWVDDILDVTQDILINRMKSLIKNHNPSCLSQTFMPYWEMWISSLKKEITNQ